MSKLDYETIANTKIKFRFAEPYASEAANIQMGVNLPGAYRGAVVTASTVPDDKITVKKETGDTDSIILHRDSDTGICTVVRETVDVELDCSSVGFPPGIDTTLYVYMTVDYDHVPQTDGEFAVVDTIGDIPPDAVMLAHIEIPSDATVIEQEYIKTDGSKRNKVASKKGILALKRQTITPGGAITRFQITDKVCWMNGYTSSRNRVALKKAASENFWPLVGGDGGQITAGSWFASQVSGSPLTIASMDEDGCYTNPWIDFDFIDTTTASVSSAFDAVYYAYVPFDELNVEDRNAGFFGLHTNEIYGRDKDGSPDSIVTDPLDLQIDSLLSLINGRVRTYHPDAASSTWSLLWRSNNIVNDTDVTNDTFSVYFNNNGFALLRGGYMSGNNFTVPVTGETGNVSAIFTYSNDMYFAKANVSSLPFSQSILIASGWDEYQVTDGDSGSFFHNIYSFYFYESAKVTMSATPDTGDNEKYIELLQLSDGNIRVYWGGYSDTDQNDLVICWGCYWYDASDKWKRTSGSSFDAYLLSIGTGGINLKRKDYTDTDYIVGWSDWSTELTLTDKMREAGTVDSVVIPFKISLSEKYLWQMDTYGVNGPTLREIVNFHSVRKTTPGTANIVQVSGENPLSSKTVEYIDTGFAIVTGVLDLTSILTEMETYDKSQSVGGTLDPFVNPNKIRVFASDVPSVNTVGKILVVKGSSLNDKAWGIVSWATGTDGATGSYYEFIVDTESTTENDREVEDEVYDSDQKVYMLTKDNNGVEVSAFHLLQIED